MSPNKSPKITSDLRNVKRSITEIKTIEQNKGFLMFKTLLKTCLKAFETRHVLILSTRTLIPSVVYYIIFSVAKYPQIEDLLIVIPIALAICVGRLVFERLVAQPIGTCIGISPRGPRKPYPNAILERVFLTITQKPDEKRLKVRH